MSTKFLAVVLAAVFAAAGVLSLTNHRPSTEGDSSSVVKTALAADPAATGSNPGIITDAYIGDFKSGYADGFNAGVTGLSYPDETSMASSARGYLDGFSQGYTDGQGQQANLRNRLCRTAGIASLTASPSVYGTQYARSSRLRSTRVLGDREYNYAYARRSDNGIGSTARKAMLIGGGAALGAGFGGAFGGRKGALIGALVGGGTGTALAVTKKPGRVFNSRVSKKSVLTKSLIGAGAGAAIGALAGGKRGALAGVALGGGGGLLYSLLSGRRSYRR
ncbi:MAG TPA: hypothetical protein VF747_09565 [Blastocatellia bacterium]|jgi:hypothetical protein